MSAGDDPSKHSDNTSAARSSLPQSVTLTEPVSGIGVF